MVRTRTTTAYLSYGKEHVMRTRATSIICIAYTSLYAAGLAMALPQDAGGYVGQLTGTNVYVRHNASMGAYPCAKLSEPETVTVVSKIDDKWLKILPPKGVFSVISKQYVEADESGSSGVVTGNNVWIRAGGHLRTDNFSGLQKQLSKGQEVRILGQTGQWYKIVPPEGAYFYISASYVKPVSAETVALSAELKPGDSPAPTPSEPAAQATEVVETETTTKPTTAHATVETEVSEKELDKAIKAFRAVEEELIQEFRRQPNQRRLDSLIGKFKGLKTPDDSHLKPYVDYYISYLNVAKDKQAALRQLEVLVRDADASQADYNLKRTEIEITDTASRERTYVAQGVLADSAIFTGGASTPKRYLLRQVDTGAVGAYLEASPGADLDSYRGKNVGVLGSTRYDADIQCNIVRAEQVVLLEQQPRLGPPVPVVGPLPAVSQPKPEVTKPSPATEKSDVPVKDAGKLAEADKPVLQAKPEPKPIPIEAKPKLIQPIELPPAAAIKAQPDTKVPQAKPVPVIDKAKPQSMRKVEPEAAIEQPVMVIPEATPAVVKKALPEASAPASPVQPKPVPAAPVQSAPLIGVQAMPRQTSSVQPMAPVVPQRLVPATRPVPVRLLPTTRLADFKKPMSTTRPAVAKPLPPSGLPIAQPVDMDAGPIDEEEYD